jgi:hypothetical protein
MAAPRRALTPVRTEFDHAPRKDKLKLAYTLTSAEPRRIAPGAADRAIP